MALGSRVFNSAPFNRRWITLNGFNTSEQFVRDLSPTHLCKTLNLWNAQYRHNAWDDGKIDTYLSSTLDKIKKVAIIKKQLGYQEICPSINFALEIDQVLFPAGAFRVLLGI